MDIWGWVLILVVAGLALFVGGCIAFVYIVLHKLGDAVTEAVGSIKDALTPSGPVYRLKLKPVQSLNWADQAAADQAINALLKLGFKHDGDYINATNTMRLAGFIHHAQRVLATVMEVGEDSGNGGANQFAIELISEHDDGWLAVTSQPDPGFDLPPDARIIRLPGASVEDLWQRMVQEQPRGAREVESGCFLDSQQRVYAHTMDFRIQRGGFRHAEVQRNLQRTGPDLPEDPEERHAMVEFCQAGLNRTLRDSFERVIGTRFRKQQGLSKEAWREVQHHVLMLHTMTDPEVLASQVMDLAGHLGAEDHTVYEAKVDELEALLADAKAQGQLIETFEQLLPQLEWGPRVEKLGELDDPVRVAIYKLPREINDWR